MFTKLLNFRLLLRNVAADDAREASAIAAKEALIQCDLTQRARKREMERERKC